ncbi:plasmid mobilization protein [Escherichia coli]|nr:plasmid mobilization protein [Escherichia coli]KHG86315.1 plasmid mobilization protein [Escherichia coli]
MRLKFIRRDRGSFSGGLLPFLPVCCRDRAERVLAVRVMRRYGKWGAGLLAFYRFCRCNPS